VDERKSWDVVDSWRADLEKKLPSIIPMMLVGNKVLL